MAGLESVFPHFRMRVTFSAESTFRQQLDRHRYFGAGPSLANMLNTPVKVTSTRRCYLWAVVLVVGALSAARIDLQLALLCRQRDLPGDLARVLTWSEAFAHGIGVALIGLVAIGLDESRRRYWARTLCMAYGAGLVVNCVKLTVGRYRPHHFFELGLESPTVADTFAGWLPFLTQGLNHGVQSFPSGHTATACGLALGMARTYPQAGWLFAALAALAAAQRVDSGAHYLSDVCAGAAVGLVVGGLLLDRRLLGGYFDRFEKRLLNVNTKN